MNTILAALLLAAQLAPAAVPQETADEAQELGRAWGRCVGSTAIASMRREAAMSLEAAVDGAMGSCTEHEQRVRAHWVEAEGEAATSAAFAELRTLLRQRAIDQLRDVAERLR